jgi:hypothetical protein
VDRGLDKPMRTFALACCGWLLAPTLALADGQAPDGHALGIAESMQAYCDKAYPPATVKFRKQIKRLVDGASDEVVANVRKSDEYRRARGSMDDFISRVDERNAKRLCSERLAANK